MLITASVPSYKANQIQHLVKNHKAVIHFLVCQKKKIRKSLNAKEGISRRSQNRFRAKAI
jgi:hypothetical protein